MYTEDGGVNWEIHTASSDQILRRGTFPDADNGWAVGNNGTITNSQRDKTLSREEAVVKSLPGHYYENTDSTGLLFLSGLTGVGIVV